MAETWTKTRTLQALKEAGTEQTRKTYRRHGVLGKQYGVKYGDLGKLVKQIKTNTKLALSLWNSGIHDARVLATMIADSSELSREQLANWATETDNDVLAGGVAQCASKHPEAWALVKEWSESDEDLVSAAGFATICPLTRSKDVPATKELSAWIRQIRDTIHDRPNRTRYAMNGALIALGLVNEPLQKQALAAAKKIGKVDVDHGDTACKTPDAEAYILKAAERQKKASH